MKEIKKYLNYDAVGACAWILSGISYYNENILLKGLSAMLLLILILAFLENKEKSCLTIKVLRFVESVVLMAAVIGGNGLNNYKPMLYITAGIIHFLCWMIFFKRSNVNC